MRVLVASKLVLLLDLLIRIYANHEDVHDAHVIEPSQRQDQSAQRERARVLLPRLRGGESGNQMGGAAGESEREGDGVNRVSREDRLNLIDKIDQAFNYQMELGHHRNCGMQTPGTLILDGGAFDRQNSEATMQSIIEEMGGINSEGVVDKEFVLITTAGSDLTEDEEIEYTERWTVANPFVPEKFTIMHPDDKDPDYTGVEDSAQADTEEFVAPLQSAAGLFMRGGRQWRLTDSYKYTRTLDEMWNCLERDCVISGTSAGCTVSGFFMPRGDQDGSSILVSDRLWHRYGFGFIRGVAFDVHVDGRDRWQDLYEVISANPYLLGIGVSEDTAIVVKGKYFKVVGDKGNNSIVAVYNCADADTCNQRDTPYIKLLPDQWYDMCERKIVGQPSPAELDVPLRNVYPLPYELRKDYRAGAVDFYCSGRFCRFTSSQIDTGSRANIVELSAVLASAGKMDNNDFLKVFTRVGDRDWVQLAYKEGALDQSEAFVSSFQTMAFDRIQIRIEAFTTKEGDAEYIVKNLKVIELRVS